MADTPPTLQASIATTHQELATLWTWLDERNERIARLRHTIEQLTNERDVLYAERESLYQRCSSLRQHVELIKADRDTLADVLIPMLESREAEAEINAARLIAVLLLASDDRNQAWQRIKQITHHPDQVTNVAEHMLMLLEQHRSSEASAPDTSEEAPEFIARISDPSLQTELHAAFQSLRTPSSVLES